MICYIYKLIFKNKNGLWLIFLIHYVGVELLKQCMCLGSGYWSIEMRARGSISVVGFMILRFRIMDSSRMQAILSRLAF